jgi:hypothetical protein
MFWLSAFWLRNFRSIQGLEGHKEGLLCRGREEKKRQAVDILVTASFEESQPSLLRPGQSVTEDPWDGSGRS